MADEPIVPDDPTTGGGSPAADEPIVKDVSPDTDSLTPNRRVARDAGDKSSANDVAAQQASVNDAASRAAALWISFLTFAAYLTVTVGSVTHEMMFKETPIRLPVLNVDLPIFAFFVLVPFFFVLFHFYLFLQLVILARKITSYNKVLRDNVKHHRDRELLRRRLDPFLIVQMLCGAKREREGLTARLLRVVAWLTLVGLPVALLLQFQLTFLPFHSSVATWVHRMIVVADLVLVWVFWFAIHHDQGEFHIPALRNHWVALSSSIFVSLFSIFAMAYYGEAVGQVFKVPFCPDGLRPLADCFFHGKVNMVKGKPSRYFSNVLVVPFKKLVDDEEAEKGTTTLSLRGRNLMGAVLIQADLRRVDFTGANLNNARLDRVRAAGAVFGCEDPGAEHLTEWPDDGCTWLQGASLSEANLEGAVLVNARLQGATLISAKLHGANLTNAQLQAAVLTQADLTAAWLKNVRLQGACLVETNLSGASLEGANLQHALLELTRFEFASVGGRDWSDNEQRGKVEVFGSVGFPNLSFASFKLSKDSQVADNYEQFIPMREAMLRTLFREEFRKLTNGALKEPSAEEIKELASRDSSGPAGSRFPLRVFVPEYYQEFYKDGHSTNWEEVESSVEETWAKALTASASPDPSPTGGAPRVPSKAEFMAKYLSSMACEGGHAPHLARGLITNGIFFRAGDHIGEIMDKLKGKSCEGAVGLRSTDFQELFYQKSYAPYLRSADSSEIPRDTAMASSSLKRSSAISGAEAAK